MISLSANGATQFSVTEPAQELLVGTARGVIRLQAEGRVWRQAGHMLETCYISALLPLPAEGMLLAGMHRGTIQISRDGGRHWEKKDAGIAHPHVYTLGAGRVDGVLTLYAGTEPAHLYASTDFGESWHELPGLQRVPNTANWDFPPPPHLAHVKHVSFDPWDPHVMYVCVEQGGIYRSADGAKTWKWLSRDIYSDVHRLVISPIDPNRFYAPTGDGLYGSGDGGRSWTHLSNRTARIAYPDAFVMHPRFERLMFMAGAVTNPLFFERNGTADSRVARSQDGGTTWEILTDGFPDHIRGNVEAMCMEVWDAARPNGFRVFAGTTDGDVFCSGEGGRRWHQIAKGLPPISKLFHYEILEKGIGNFRKAS